jgi:integrase
LLPPCFPGGSSMKLDAKTVAALDLAGKRDLIVFDEELPGFGLRLRGSSDRVRRSWVAQYRAQGRTRRVLIGSVEKVAPLDARKAARKILAEASLGGDPQGAKAQVRREAARTVRSVVDSYLQARQPELRPGSYRIARLYLTGPYFRSLHSLAVTAVTRADVAAAVRAIVTKHSAATAAAARRQISAFFSWTISEGLLGNAANPVDGSYCPDGPAARDRVLSSDELVHIWRACLNDDFGKITKLLVLLGSRPREVGGMRWSELDLDAGTWTLPAERAKNGRAHTIVLSTAVLHIIHSVPRSTRDNLFGNRAGSGFTNWTKCKRGLDRRLAGAVKPFQLRDVRRTVATGMAGIGIEPHHVEAVLSHYGGHRAGVAGVYNRASYTSEIARALQRWADHVEQLVSGKKPSSVVKLSRRRTEKLIN